MISRICTAIVAVSFIFIPTAHAAETKAKLKGATCYGTIHKVSCGYIGEVTIKEIYEKGWRVVSLVKEDANTVSLIIEEQG